MIRKPRAGILPLYLKLYDEVRAEGRAVFRPFLDAVASGLTTRGVHVVETEICRLADEFAAAIERLEREDVDIIVTLHLAYSPSLEAVEALSSSRLPILMLDTTMDFDFGQDVPPDRIMRDHGIHGVMDLASVLRRRRREYAIVAGHLTESDVLDRAAGIARAAYGARQLRQTKVLRIGDSFAGMGDFAVDERILRDALGVTVDQQGIDELVRAADLVSDRDVDGEIALDRERYAVEAPQEVHARSVRAGLGLRRVLEKGDYSAFSMNFLAFDRAEGSVSTVPFLEASKGMARGVGYAGEGDVLTASLVGALARAFGRTTFTEVFCPDWRGNALFLSHMGEFNPEIAGERPRLVEKAFPYTRAQNPAILAAAPAPGSAVFVNIAPGPGDTFGLIISPVELLGDSTHEKMRNAVRGWMRPDSGVAEFLEAYSREGGTHHSALVVGGTVEALASFAAFAGVKCVRI